MSELEQRLIDSSDTVKKVSDTVHEIITFDEDANVTYADSTIPSLAKRVNDYLSQLVQNGSFDGDDGIGIKEANINDAGELVIELTNETVFNLGNIVGTDGVGIENINIIGRELIITMTDQTEYNLGAVKGIDGKSITNAYIDGKYLKVDLSDNTTIIAGDISVFGGVSAKNAAISESGRLILTFSDGRTSNVGQVVGSKGTDGINIVTAYIDKTGVLNILMSNGQNIKAGNVQTTTIDSSRAEVTNVEINDEGHLIIAFADNSTIDAGLVKGKDAIGVDSTSIDDSGNLIVTLSNGTTIDAGNVRKTVISGIDINIANVTFNEDREVIISVYNGVDTTDYNLGKIDGKDGTSIESASINDESRLVFSMSDGTIIDAGLLESNTITNVNIDDSGHLQLILSSGESLDVGNIISREGNDGISLKNANINNDGDLIISLSDGNNINVGNVQRKVETNVEIENNKIKFTFSDGSTQEFEGIKGQDGVFPRNVTIEDGVLKVELSDGEIIEAGKINTSIESASVNDSGELVLTTYSGNTLTAGNIKGTDGVGIQDISRNGENLNIKLTDDMTYTFENILGHTGIGIDNIDFDGQDLIISRTNGEVTRIEQVRGVDGTSIDNVQFTDDNGLVFNLTDGSEYTIPNVKGVDGLTIQNIDLIDNDLTISLSDNNTVTVPSVKGVDGLSIDNIVYNESENQLEISLSNGTVTTFPVIKGKDAPYIVSSNVTPQGELSFKLSDDNTINAGNIGKAVDNANINENGNLIINYTDGTNDTLGEITAVNGTSVTNIQINDNDEVIVTLSDSSTINAGSISRIEVSNVNIREDDGHLIITSTDGSTLDTGRVRGVDGREITSASINEQGHLILSVNDNTTIDTGNAQGEQGVYVDDIQIYLNGDIIVTYSNGTTENAGNIGSGTGLVPYDSEASYQRNQAVIHDGNIYIALNDNPNQPPSNNWNKVLFEGNIPDIRKPVAISPKSGNNTRSLTPELVGSTYAPIIESDEREYREFHFSTTSGQISQRNIVRAQSDSYIIPESLKQQTTYYWQCRDKNKITGFVSSWSDEESFVIPENYIETPNINYEGSLTNTSIVPEFKTSSFNVAVGSDTHISSDWLVSDNSGNIVYESLNDKINLTSIVIPKLQNLTTYKIQARFNGENLTSSFSASLEFTTNDELITITTPSIFLTGDDNFVSINPRFLTSEFICSLPTIKHTSSDWEVYDSNGQLYWSSYEDNNNKLSKTMQNKNLIIGSSYTARVRHRSDYAGTSEWSDPIPMEVQYSIEKPTVSTEADITAMPSSAIFNGSKFAGLNEKHVSTEWEMISSINGELLYNSGRDTFNLTTNNITIPFGREDEDIQIRIRYHGLYTSSEWSDWLMFHTTVTKEDAIYISGTNMNYVVDFNGRLLRTTFTSNFTQLEKFEDGYLAITGNYIVKYTSTWNVSWYNNNSSTNLAQFIVYNDNIYVSNSSGDLLSIDSEGKQFNIFSISESNFIIDKGYVYSFRNTRYISLYKYNLNNGVGSGRLVFYDTGNNGNKSSSYFENNIWTVNTTHRGTLQYNKDSGNFVTSDGEFGIAYNNIVNYNNEKFGSINNVIYKITGYNTNESIITVPNDIVKFVIINGNYYIQTSSTFYKFNQDFVQEYANISHGSVGTYTSIILEGDNLIASSNEGIYEIDESTGDMIDFKFSYATANCIDKDGNYYLAYGPGGKFNLVKHDSKMNVLWRNTSHSKKILHISNDNNGFAYTVEDGGLVRKIDSSGNQVWQYQIPWDTRPNHYVYPDDDGNVYANEGSRNYIVKLTPSGNKLWSRGIANISHQINDFKIDKNYIYAVVYSASNFYGAYRMDHDGNNIQSLINIYTSDNSINFYFARSLSNIKNGIFIFAERSMINFKNNEKSNAYNTPSDAIYNSVSREGSVYGLSSNTLYKVDLNGNVIWNLPNINNNIKQNSIMAIPPGQYQKIFGQE